jgi:transcriptional regulator with XRE-family HTH domain
VRKTQEQAPFWTSSGLKRLGKLIKSSLESHGISQNEAAQRITKATGFYITKGGLNKVLNATTKMPEFNTLVAIAASQLVMNEEGVPLTIYDFIDIASESYVIRSGMDKLISLINQEMAKREMSPQQLAKAALMDYSRLQSILERREIQNFDDDVAALASILTNPAIGEPFSYPDDLAEYCNLEFNENPAHVEQEERHTMNGFC